MAEKGGLLKHFVIPIVIAIAIVFFTGMNFIFAIILGFVVYFGVRVLAKYFKAKSPELVFKDHYKDIKAEMVEGSKRSCPPGEFKLYTTGSRRLGIPAKYYGDVIGIVSLRKYRVTARLKEKPKGAEDYITVYKDEKTKDGKKKVDHYKFYEEETIGMMVISTPQLIGGKMHILLPLSRMSPLDKVTVAFGHGFKCIDKEKSLYTLQWESKGEIADEIEERVLQDSLLQKRNVALVSVYANATEIAAKMNAPAQVDKERKSVEV